MFARVERRNQMESDSHLFYAFVRAYKEFETLEFWLETPRAPLLHSDETLMRFVSIVTSHHFSFILFCSFFILLTAVSHCLLFSHLFFNAFILLLGGYSENMAYDDGYYGRDSMDPRQMGNGCSQQHHYDPDYDDCQDNDFDMDFGGDFGF